MSNAHMYFRKRIREIEQLQEEIDRWYIVTREWRTGDCHNRLLQEYMKLTGVREEIIDLVSGKWDKFHNSGNTLKAMTRIIDRMHNDLALFIRLFTGHWGKHVARKYHIPKDKPYGLRVSVQHITYRFNRLKIYNIIGNDGMNDLRRIPFSDDVFCIVTRLQFNGEEIRDEEVIRIYENA